jgi:hypothetical protein
MKCPYLIVEDIPTCRAEGTPYVPTSIQIEDYCRSKFNNQCPLFRASMRRRKMKTDLCSTYPDICNVHEI